MILFFHSQYHPLDIVWYYMGGGTFRRRRFGAGQLGAVPFRRRFLFFSIYEEKTMKQAIS